MVLQARAIHQHNSYGILLSGSYQFYSGHVRAHLCGNAHSGMMVRGIMMQTDGQHRAFAQGSRKSRTLQAPKERTAFLLSSAHIARLSRPTIFRTLPGNGAIKAAADAEGALVRSPEENDFSFEATVPAGRLVVAPLSRNTMRGASVVLTRAFAASEERTPISDVQEFVDELVTSAKQQVLLVASLFPTDASLLGPGQSSRVVGTVSLSFTRDTRETFLTLQPPDDATYLSNMSVDPNLRRQGIAREMLAACESFITSRNYSRDVHLHVNASNKDAQALYASQGWAIVDQDGPWVRLAGRIPVVLMKKTYVA